jgi:hypothetical protein
VSTRQPVTVTYDEPFASAPVEKTIRLQFPTTPHFSSGATISQQTARELFEGLRKILQEPEESRLTISTRSQGVLWDRPMEDGKATLLASDHALLSYLLMLREDAEISVK